MPTDYGLIERIRQTTLMSKQIARKDPEYSKYVGASWEIAEKMVMIDLCLEQKLLPETLTPFLKLFRAYLDKKRKAWFASVASTEITKLGFIIGEENDTIDATETETK